MPSANSSENQLFQLLVVPKLACLYLNHLETSGVQHPSAGNHCQIQLVQHQTDAAATNTFGPHQTRQKQV